MIIGSDFDGVIANDTIARIKFIKQKYGVELPPSEIHGSFLEGKLGANGKQDVDTSCNCSDWTMQFTPMPFVGEVFRRLIKGGDEIIIITARNKDGIGWAKQFMELHNIPFTNIWSSKELFVNPEGEQSEQSEKNRTSNQLTGKGRLAESIMPAVFVEDSDAHLANLAPLGNQIKLLLFNHPYNQTVKNVDNFERVFDWNDIYDKIQELKRVEVVK